MLRKNFIIGVGVVIAAIYTGLSAEMETPEDSESSEELFLDLGSVIERVESSNLQLLLNREGIEEALQRVYEQRSGLYPSLGVGVGQSRSQFVNVGRGFDIPGANPVSPPSNRFDLQLQANLRLIDTDLIASYRSAKLGLEITELQYETLLQDVIVATVTSYMNHLRNLSSMAVIQANIERNRSLLELAQDRFNSGVATQIDVTRAEVALAASEQNSLQQETLLLESELLLKQLLDIDLDRPIRLDPLQERLEESPRIQQSIEMEALLSKRTEYQSAQVEMERRELARKAANWQRFPQVSLFGNYGYASDEAFSGNYEEQWGAGIELSFPIFEGFRIRSERLRAESTIRSQEFILRELENQVGSEYRLQIQDVRSTFDQIKVAKKGRDLSLRELELATTRFQEGVADNTEVIDAQRNLAAAEDNYIEALYRYGLARLGLARAIGEVRSVLDYQ
jgi:outer membrane protein TolC